MSADAAAEDGALVLFSGGQDSAVCLAWALARHRRVETVGFDYGQRHRVELDCRRALLAVLPGACPVLGGAVWAGRLGEDHLLALPTLAALSETAMTREVAIAAREDGLPNTFVPGRNVLFLTYAAALAARRGLRRLVAGMCETDYSGYPDCRDDTLKALQVTLNLAMPAARRKGGFVIETPLMWRDKAATWALAERLGGDRLVDLVVEHTHTCYLGDRTRRHPWGYGCGVCPACALRRGGWQRFVAERRCEA